MWEALMMVRLIASIAPTFSNGNGASVSPVTLPAETLKGMIRLSFAAYRLSLPLSDHRNETRNHDQKIA